jgi:hypothetical protein
MKKIVLSSKSNLLHKNHQWRYKIYKDERLEPVIRACCTNDVLYY